MKNDPRQHSSNKGRSKWIEMYERTT